MKSTIQFFGFLLSKKHLWADKETRRLRYLILWCVPVGAVVHVAMGVHSTSGWGYAFEVGLREIYTKGDIGAFLFAIGFLMFVMAIPLLTLAINQLNVETNPGLVVLLITAVGIIVADIVIFLDSRTSQIALWVTPFLCYWPAAFVGSLVAGVYRFEV